MFYAGQIPRKFETFHKTRGICGCCVLIKSMKRKAHEQRSSLHPEYEAAFEEVEICLSAQKMRVVLPLFHNRPWQDASATLTTAVTRSPFRNGQLWRRTALADLSSSRKRLLTLGNSSCGAACPGDWTTACSLQCRNRRRIDSKLVSKLCHEHFSLERVMEVLCFLPSTHYPFYDRPPPNPASPSVTCSWTST